MDQVESRIPVLLMSGEWHKVILLLLLSVLTGSAYGYVSGSHPTYTVFTPDIEFYPQNFSIAQTDDARIFIGSTDGVLGFDGETWQLVRVPGGEIVRSVMADGERLYVGGFNSFGYLDPAETGELVYHPLEPLFSDFLQDENFADIWDMLVVPEGVLFQALRYVFLWNPRDNSTAVWAHEGRFGAMVRHQGRKILQFRGEGLRWLDNGQWTPVPGTGALTELVTDLLPMPDGSLLSIQGEGGWKKISPDGVADYPMNPLMPAPDTLTSGVVMADGSMAFSSNHGTVYLYDPVDDTVQSAKVESGYLNGVVEGADNLLFTAGDRGFYALQCPAVWELLDDRNGLESSLLNARWDGNTAYVLSSNGVYRKQDNEEMFSRLDWTGNEAWDLLFLGNGDALLCESYVLLYLHNGVMTEVPGASQVYPRVLLRSAFNPDLVYVGTETGMALLERMGDNWIYVYHNTEMDNWQATTLVELAEGRILVGTERGGIRALDFEKDGEWQLVANRHLVTDQNGEGILSDSAVFRTQDGNILASMGDALYSYADGNLQSGALGALAAARTDTRTLYFSEDQSGQKWAFSWNRLYRESGAGSWEQVDFSGLGAGVLNELVFDQSGDPVFVFDTGLGFYNAHLPAGEHQPALRISSVRVTNALEQVKPLSLAPGTRPRMAQTDWINIRFSLPDFRNPERVQYNTRLKPIEQGDNRWDESSQVSFFALEPGDYEFELTARDSQGRVSDTLHYAFSVAPWWYQTAAMKVLWVIIALTGFSSLMWYGAWLRSRRLLVANANLEMQVRQRTLELEHANRQLGNLANLDGLTGIPNRRKLQSYLEDVWTRCADHERELTLILFDVDHFKNYNDKYGHQTGDEALRNLVQVVARCLRRSEDMVARYGGEEFIVVLPGAGLAVGMAVAEEIRLAVEASDAGVTLSAGVACGRPQVGEDPASATGHLIALADRAMYGAKRAGRNRVNCHETA